MEPLEAPWEGLGVLWSVGGPCREGLGRQGERFPENGAGWGWKTKRGWVGAAPSRARGCGVSECPGGVRVSPGQPLAWKSGIRDEGWAFHLPTERSREEARAGERRSWNCEGDGHPHPTGISHSQKLRNGGAFPKNPREEANFPKTPEWRCISHSSGGSLKPWMDR